MLHEREKSEDYKPRLNDNNKFIINNIKTESAYH